MAMSSHVQVVLGATGGVGQAVVQVLVAQGAQVRAVNRSGRAPVQASVEVMAADLTDRESTRAACQGAIFKVVAVEPNHSLVWASQDGHYSMVMALYPIDARHTRLVWRIHGAYNWTSLSIIIPQLFSDLADGIAVRQNMLGIKERTEGAVPEAPAVTYTELGLWLAAFLGFLVAETGLVIRRDWLRPLLAVSATGLITICLVLVKPPLWVDGLVTLGVLAGLWWTYRPAAQRAVPGTGKHAPGETRGEEVEQ